MTAADGPPYDIHTLYECCVQAPDHAVRLLWAIHAGEPRVLGEDFAGTGAVSRRWIDVQPERSAIAVDANADVLSRCAGVDRIRAIVGDVRTATDPTRDTADVIFVGNFSIGELHDRATVVEYLRLCRARMNPQGVFICDTYGGESAFLTGSVEREHPGPNGERILYTWEQREANPLSGRVMNALHFRVFDGDDVVQDVEDAFVYDWRLWSVPELCDAMREAGFATTEVYSQLIDAVDDDGRGYARPIEDPTEELDDSFIVCVAGRA